VLLARADACLTVTVEWHGDRQGRIRLTRLPGAGGSCIQSAQVTLRESSRSVVADASGRPFPFPDLKLRADSECHILNAQSRQVRPGLSGLGLSHHADSSRESARDAEAGPGPPHMPRSAIAFCHQTLTTKPPARRPPRDRVVFRFKFPAKSGIGGTGNRDPGVWAATACRGIANLPGTEFPGAVTLGPGAALADSRKLPAGPRSTRTGGQPWRFDARRRPAVGRRLRSVAMIFSNTFLKLKLKL
jgi:hypothetical protein